MWRNLIFSKTFFIQNVKPLEFRGKQGNSGSSKIGGKITTICFNFLRNENYVNKISSRNSALRKILFKICLESFVFSYHSGANTDKIWAQFFKEQKRSVLNIFKSKLLGPSEQQLVLITIKLFKMAKENTTNQQNTSF